MLKAQLFYPVDHLAVAQGPARRNLAQDCGGFTLTMASILLIVAALIFVSVLPGQEAGDINQKNINNIQKLERVEEAMRAFMAFKGRRPCPADGSYAVNTPNFGLEAATPGTCTVTSGMIGPDATTYIVGGVIPTRSLSLPDDYAFDDFGRRFTYLVDTRATLNSSCANLEGISSTNFTPNGTGGGLVIQNTSTVNGGVPIDNVMYAYISHGVSGYGAWPAQGGGNRINSGSTDVDMQTNAGVNPNFTTHFTNVKVQKDWVTPTSGDTGFDDVVWYRPDLKNICCLGPACLANITLYRKKITIDHTHVGGDLTNFPLLVTFSYDIDIGNYATTTAPAGHNIRFYAADASGNVINYPSQPLKYERQSFSGGGSSPAYGTFWVQVPTISSTADTVIYIYYDPSVVTDGQDAAGTWDSNFGGVWHMEQNGLPFIDSTINSNNSIGNSADNNGITGGNVGFGPGLVGNGNAMESGGSHEWLDVGQNSSIQPGSFTLAAWVNNSAVNNTAGIISSGSPACPESCGPGTNYGYNLFFYLGNVYLQVGNGITYGTVSVPAASGWQYIVATYSGSMSLYIYAGGNLVSTNTASSSGLAYNSSDTLFGAIQTIGATFSTPLNGYCLAGTMDEVRISSTVRSPDWINFEYHNIYDSGNDLTWGPAE